MREITWLFTDRSIDKEVVSQVEKSFGIKFPNDYKECVLKTL